MSLRRALANRHSERYAWGPLFQEAADLTDGLMPQDHRFEPAQAALHAMDAAYHGGRAGDCQSALHTLKDLMTKEPSHEQTTFAM